MKPTLLLAAFLLATGLSQAEMRLWTSADDASKTFEGEMQSLTGETVTIRTKAGKTISAPLAKFAQADQDYAKKAKEEKAEAAKSVEAAAKLKDSAMGKELGKSTVILDGKKMKKHDLFAAKAPEYFLVYWGASW
jgi:hypothetical protein